MRENKKARILCVDPVGGTLGHFDHYDFMICEHLTEHTSVTLLTTDRAFLPEPRRFSVERLSLWTYKGGIHKGRFRDRIASGVVVWLNMWRFLRHSWKLAHDLQANIVVFFVVEFLPLSFFRLIHRHRFLLAAVVHHPFQHPAAGDFAGLIQLYNQLSLYAIRNLLNHPQARLLVHGEVIRGFLNPHLSRLQQSRVHVLPFGVDAELASQKMQLPPELAGRGFPRPLLLCFGSLRRNKGYGLIAQALASLKGELHVLIAGAPVNITVAEVELLLRPASSRVTLLARYLKDDEIPALYKLCEATLAAYDRDFHGESGPILIGFSVGKIAIVADTGQMAENVKKEDLGFTFAAHDWQALACVLEEFSRMYHDPSQREILTSMERKALRFASERSWRKVAQQLYALCVGAAASGNLEESPGERALRAPTAKEN